MARFNGWRLTRAGFIFIVVTLLLAVVVFAGVRFAQQRGEQVRQDEAAEIARQNQDESDTPVIAVDTPAPEETGQQASGGTVATTDTTQAAPAALPETGVANFLPVLLLAVATYGATWAVRGRRAAVVNTSEG